MATGDRWGVHQFQKWTPLRFLSPSWPSSCCFFWCTRCASTTRFRSATRLWMNADPYRTRGALRAYGFRNPGAWRATPRPQRPVRPQTRPWSERVYDVAERLVSPMRSALYGVYAGTSSKLARWPFPVQNKSRVRRRGDATGPRRRGDYVSNTWDARATPWRESTYGPRPPKPLDFDTAAGPWPGAGGASGGGAGGTPRTHFNAKTRYERY